MPGGAAATGGAGPAPAVAASAAHTPAGPTHEHEARHQTGERAGPPPLVRRARGVHGPGQRRAAERRRVADTAATARPASVLTSSHAGTPPSAGAPDGAPDGTPDGELCRSDTVNETRLQLAAVELADRVHERRGALLQVDVGRADHRVGGARRGDGRRHRARRHLQRLLLPVGQALDHRLAAGQHVDRRCGGGVPHDQPGLPGRDRRHVVHERGDLRVAARVEVRHQRDVAARGQVRVRREHRRAGAVGGVGGEERDLVRACRAARRGPGWCRARSRRSRACRRRRRRRGCPGRRARRRRCRCPGPPPRGR